MRLACPPCECWFFADLPERLACLSFLADLSASALELLGALRRARGFSTIVENINTQTVPRAEFMALVVLTENVKVAGLYHFRVDAQLPPHLHSMA